MMSYGLSINTKKKRKFSEKENRRAFPGFSDLCQTRLRSPGSCVHAIHAPPYTTVRKVQNLHFPWRIAGTIEDLTARSGLALIRAPITTRYRAWNHGTDGGDDDGHWNGAKRV
ncbi:RNA2 polyprotein [Gossypium arboreum]|uniref:RNA2 polyprotein n=1 Tax=Gossypium arboreum TaxID=29729 RepID=A0A0B0PL60_GOSAR|nr:RNA2 polyprotein [Gossypium arboreum]